MTSMFLKSQRNQFFQELLERGLQPIDFTETIRSDWYLLALTEEPNAIWFRVDRIKNKEGSSSVYQISKRPGTTSNPDERSISQSKEWKNYPFGCLDNFRDWINDVRREVEVVDLWLEASQAMQLFSSDTALAADRFTIAELGSVQGQLNILRKSFSTSELPEEAKQRLAEIAQTAMLKAEVLTKKDWQYWIQGAFSSTVTSLELTEAQIQEVVALIRLAFGGLFLQA